MNDTAKRWGLIAGAAILAISVTACSTGGKDTASPSPSASQAAQETTVPDASAPGETVKQATGEYVGLADSHTVEIVTDGEPVSYQFDTASLLDTMNQFQKGDLVSFAYEIKDIGGGNTQNWLTKIEKAAPAGSISPAESGQGAAADLPAKMDLTLLLEGSEEVKTATLATGNGFALYVFDIFSFDPQRSLLTMNVDPNYYASIEKLPAGYSLEDMKKTALEELSRVGDVRQLAASEIDPALGDVSLYLTASNDKLVQSVIVKKVDGTGYKIKLNKPIGEPMEGFGPHVSASLGTLTNL
jgi:hypothetical protein